MSVTIDQRVEDFTATGTGDFRDHKADFDQANTVILGASRDGLGAQENFKAKQRFDFTLVSDKDEALSEESGYRAVTAHCSAETSFCCCESWACRDLRPLGQA